MKFSNQFQNPCCNISDLKPGDCFAAFGSGKKHYIYVTLDTNVILGKYENHYYALDIEENRLVRFTEDSDCKVTRKKVTIESN